MSTSGYKNIAFRIGAFAVLLACAVWQMWFSYLEQKDFSDRSEQTLTTDTRNFRALTHSAKQQYMLEADLDSAMSLLQRALTLNPSYVPAWLSLAELNNDLGQKEKAYAILQHVDLLTEGLKRWRWDKALTAYQLGKLELLPEELRYIIQEFRGKERNDALQLAFTLWEEPGDLLENIGNENINHLLGHAVRKKLVQPALFFWRSMEAAGVAWQQKEGLALLDMLLQVGEVQEAASIWRKHFNPDQLLFNGDFSQPFSGQAFDWRTGKKQNFDQLIQTDLQGGTARSMHYRFKGWENINFAHLSQIVPLEGGKTYTLTAEMKSQKMTTNQRPFLEVLGYKCKAPVKMSEMVAPDQDWTQHQVTVDVPEECNAMVIRLRRKESTHIDSKLAGQLWLRNFNLVEMAEVSLAPDTQQR